MLLFPIPGQGRWVYIQLIPWFYSRYYAQVSKVFAGIEDKVNAFFNGMQSIDKVKIEKQWVVLFRYTLTKRPSGQM